MRRTFLAGTASALAAPSLARSEAARVLRLIPQADLAVLDPVWTSVHVTRNHGYMVFCGCGKAYASMTARPYIPRRLLALTGSRRDCRRASALARGSVASARRRPGNRRR